ncbi:MAG: hypothetical protein MHM6MM_002491 [Cercozoa sp. M6MM]
MVLADLGKKLQGALRSLSSAEEVDDDALKHVMRSVCAALLQADVNAQLVKQLRDNVMRRLSDQSIEASANRKRLITQAVADELVTLLDGGDKERQPWKPKRGEANVVMFVGLQGAGKTTSVTKLAYHFKQQKGLRTAIVCADTYRAGAFDQLRQNATKARVPFFGSYDESDPVKVASQGVEQFRREGFEVIIVDTSGRHKQEAALFEEMRAVADAIQPDETIFVMDASIGQAAKDQAEAFRSATPVGSVILTKLDGHSKGGGALSAVAATKAPITFIGTGERIDQFEPFDTRGFVSRLLGFGDLAGLTRKIQALDIKNEEQVMTQIASGKLTMRLLRDQFENVSKLGPLGNVIQMVPGLSQLMPEGGDQDAAQRMRVWTIIMDSMTNEELDSDPSIFTASRIKRIARGAGVTLGEVQQLLQVIIPFQQNFGQLQKLAKLKQKGRGVFLFYFALP